MNNFDHEKTRNLMYLNSALAMLRAADCFSYGKEIYRGIDGLIDELKSLRNDVEDIKEGACDE
jgi:hypothetical protein